MALSDILNILCTSDRKDLKTVAVIEQRDPYSPTNYFKMYNNINTYLNLKTTYRLCSLVFLQLQISTVSQVLFSNYMLKIQIYFYLFINVGNCSIFRFISKCCVFRGQHSGSVGRNLKATRSPDEAMCTITV